MYDFVMTRAQRDLSQHFCFLIRYVIRVDKDRRSLTVVLNYFESLTGVGYTGDRINFRWDTALPIGQLCPCRVLARGTEANNLQMGLPDPPPPVPQATRRPRGTARRRRRCLFPA